MKDCLLAQIAEARAAPVALEDRLAVLSAAESLTAKTNTVLGQFTLEIRKVRVHGPRVTAVQMRQQQKAVCRT